MRKKIPQIGDRVEFLQKLNIDKDSIIAEIGVDYGDHAEQIVETLDPNKLYLIDPWDGREEQLDTVQKRFSITASRDTSLLLESSGVIGVIGKSAETANNFPDEYFDLVYIDADHTYESVKDDISTWFPKVKIGGWITGHDYVDGYDGDPYEYGVIQAVNELVVKHDLSLSFVGKWKDWAVRKK